MLFFLDCRLFRSLLALWLCTTSGYLQAQFSISIVAVDATTGEIGCAGASCLDEYQFPGTGGAILMADMHPGRGAVLTQAAWNPDNQSNAHTKMQENMAPSAIIEWLQAHDANFSPAQRQYAIVDLDEKKNARVAGFTGPDCAPYKNQIIGPNYAIQGNFLSGPPILDSMQARFLRTNGPLSLKLMAAMQGANIVGADTRCAANGTSSLSAFIRIARPEDVTGSYYLDLNVAAVLANVEPIDSLQRAFSQWWMVESRHPAQKIAKLYPNPAVSEFFIDFYAAEGVLELYDNLGQLVYTKPLDGGINRIVPPLPSDSYLLRIRNEHKTILTERLFWQSE